LLTLNIELLDTMSNVPMKFKTKNETFQFEPCVI